MRLLAAGSIARDHLEGPFGSVDEELGGSALYFALAASLIGPVEVVAPVGAEDAAAVHSALQGRRIDLQRLSVVDAPTYRWSARQVSRNNEDLGSQDSIYDVWRPEPPAGFNGWAFVGSMRPDRQADAARALGSAGLLAGDSMRSYVGSRPAEAAELLHLCDWFFANEEELAALGGDPRDPSSFLSRWQLEGVVVKAGPDGSTAWTKAGATHVPALQGPVIDVTGAGDSLAGGMLSRWQKTGGRPGGLADALAHGAACAALAISAIGIRGLTRATPDDLARLLPAGEDSAS
ncbi:MAG: hypothetical protein NVS9B1_18620 [Candidatus Dormibacteraceae bacterium]